MSTQTQTPDNAYAFTLGNRQHVVDLDTPHGKIICSLHTELQTVEDSLERRLSTLKESIERVQRNLREGRSLNSLGELQEANMVEAYVVRQATLTNTLRDALAMSPR